MEHNIGSVYLLYSVRNRDKFQTDFESLRRNLEKVPVYRTSHRSKYRLIKSTILDLEFEIKYRVYRRILNIECARAITYLSLSLYIRLRDKKKKRVKTGRKEDGCEDRTE